MPKKSYKPPMIWLKVVSTKWLYGSIRFDLEPAERSVWIDLLALANESPLRGIVCASKGVPFPHDWLAQTLKVPIEVLDSTITKCKEEGRITEDTGGLQITNWDFYQAPPPKERKAKKKATEPEEDRELNEDQLLQQARLDALAIADYKHNHPQQLDDLCREMGPVRVLAAQKSQEAHPEE